MPEVEELTYVKMRAVIAEIQTKEPGVTARAIEDFLMGDWPSWVDHLAWLSSAPVAEIASWVLASGFWEVEG